MSDEKVEELYVSSDDDAPLKYEGVEDVLYDNQADMEDERFVNEHYRGSSSGILNSRVQKSTKKRFVSDAHLSCPACFDTLCLECQRHQIYANQYRAVMVMNVRIDHLKIVKADGTPAKLGKFCGETFHPVQCDSCGTEVGMYDSDSVYHFYNAIATS
mmetsp:Transcript_14669/g.20842  ORF Transcript_14669/g.20842 Transcript_14669/m.20842 type:complete len:158 (+) Transcript_14669:42-515(+)|eukprot:CAMPEP_0171467098 /NCGR_PEP_ID=MMETSP0945-20130129/9722_1 /TAXON_ID=109269 /ORGANISM="Vaucheria litorea, Strain CCMP2940" /LENGTH=157 /DNA_ID=CAMNT_0011995457 /DNA_START=26 /DNA_END=499 /DNA_ORIENTATION=+